MALEVNVRYENIMRPVSVVFDAIVNPAKMTNYFISSASGPMEAGKEIEWEFKDHDVRFPIHVVAVQRDEHIAFLWEAHGENRRVDIRLEALENDRTAIQITEREFDTSEAGIAAFADQSKGWTDFVCSLKAWLYTGVNLRNGKLPG